MRKFTTDDDVFFGGHTEVDNETNKKICLFVHIIL